MLLPLFEDIVDSLRLCISLPKVAVVVGLAKLIAKRGEGGMNFFFWGILCSYCATNIMQVEVQWHILKRFLINDSSQDTLDSFNGFE